MLMFRENVVPFSDLRIVSIECGDCHTLILLDITGQHEVKHCPTCHREFDPGVKETLAQWHVLYLRAEKAKHKLAFRIPVKDEVA